MPIPKLKKLKFFEKIKWDLAEKGLLKMPAVKLKKPKAENFDEIEYDSDDPDFAHELDNMQEYELEHRSNSKGLDDSNRLTQMSAFYNHTPSEWRKLKENHNDSMEHLVVDDCYFEQENSTKIPGFSF